jgi:serine/threonine protein kinase
MSDETQVIDILKETRRNLNSGKVVFSRGDEQKGFELERELGSGGMGVVWLARDLDVEGRVALKFLPGLVRDPVAERDLRDEVRNARDLVHENIVSVRRLHKDEASIAVEMEFVDGPSVSRLIAESPNCWLDPEKIESIIRGLCLAIDYAWQPPRRLVHRDVKPLNLLLNSNGIVKVVDFGIAHSVSETVARLTSAAAARRVVGSLPYMSPQQLKGEILHHNDVYSIGATIYELLTGTPPFRAKDVATLTQQINHEEPASMTERRKQIVAEKNRRVSGGIAVPKLWEEVVASCLEKDPAKRPQTAREIAVRLRLVADTLTVPPYGFGKIESLGNRTRRKQLMMAAASVVLAGVGAAAWFFWPRTLPSVSPQKITEEPAVNQPRDEPKTAETAKAEVPSKPVENKGSVVPSVSEPRQNWQLAATTPTVLTVSDADGKPLFDGTLATGEKHAFPVDKPVLVEVKKGTGLTLNLDGQVITPPAVDSNRWIMTIPSERNATPVLREAPPPPLPFEAEVGPLLKAGQINQLESKWLRAAMGGEKGEEERSLVRQLFTKNSPITLSYWRANTAFEFKPDAAALISSDPLLTAHAIDLILQPGGATMRLIRLEGGTFRRGSPPDELGRRPSDLPAATSKISRPFFIGKFEVTQKQFESVLKRNTSYWRGNPTWPVDQVTWNDIMGPMGYVAKLNAELAKQFDGVLVADLPTEEEWEYACRAGAATAFNSGQDCKKTDNDPGLSELAIYNRASGGPRPVGTLTPNAWGLYDMHGNLQEWTQNRYVRGGSWQSKASACRSASRIQMNRDAGGSNQTGFRLLLRLRDPNAAR